MTTFGKLVLIRHGESEYNKKNLFCGWVDCGLTERGLNEGREAGKILKESEIPLNQLFTSVLKRSIETADLVCEELGLADIPVTRSWKLNERHYGSLQGLSKSQVAEEYGEDQVKIWRRSFSIPPPAFSPESEELLKHQSDNADISPEDLPNGESLELTIKRVKPYYISEILPKLQSGENILIVAHGNSLRAIVCMMENMSEDEVIEFNIPTGIPLVMEPVDEGVSFKRKFLIDEEELKKRTDEVANQGKSSK